MKNIGFDSNYYWKIVDNDKSICYYHKDNPNEELGFIILQNGRSFFWRVRVGESFCGTA
jgi:hypothetical protein